MPNVPAVLGEKRLQSRGPSKSLATESELGYQRSVALNILAA